MKKLFIIDNKFKDNLYLYQVIHIFETFISLFISFLLGFILNYNKNFQCIHIFNYLKRSFINNYILNSIDELKYTRFQQILNFIFKVNCHFIIKKDIKDEFRNMFIVL